MPLSLPPASTDGDQEPSPPLGLDSWHPSSEASSFQTSPGPEHFAVRSSHPLPSNLDRPPLPGSAGLSRAVVDPPDVPHRRPDENDARKTPEMRGVEPRCRKRQGLDDRVGRVLCSRVACPLLSPTPECGFLDSESSGSTSEEARLCSAGSVRKCDSISPRRRSSARSLLVHALTCCVRIHSDQFTPVTVGTTHVRLRLGLCWPAV